MDVVSRCGSVMLMTSVDLSGVIELVVGNPGAVDNADRGARQQRAARSLLGTFVTLGTSTI